MARCRMSHQFFAGFAPDGNKGWLTVAILLGLPIAIAVLTNCGSGSHIENAVSNPAPPALKITVNPPSATVAPGSTTTFTASPNPPTGFSLVWSVSPTSGGTI